MTGAPGSHQRTWAENDVFRLFFLVLPRIFLLDRVKTVVGFAPLSRPTYALANVGHPSRSYPLLLRHRLRTDG
jgi:hypothetical protein